MSAPSTDQQHPAPHRYTSLTLTNDEIALVSRALQRLDPGDGRPPSADIRLLRHRLDEASRRPIAGNMWFINVYAMTSMGSTVDYTCLDTFGFSCEAKRTGAHIDPKPFSTMLTMFSGIAKSMDPNTQDLVENVGEPQFISYLVKYGSIYNKITDSSGMSGILLAIEREPGTMHSLDLDKGGVTHDRINPRPATKSR